MFTATLVLAQLATVAPAYDADTDRPPLALTLELPCEGCKTDDNLVVSPRPEAQRDQLVVYLVGTNNDADNFGLVLDAAAHAGFHGLAVGWVNGQTFLDYCAEPGSADAGNACMDEYADHLRLGDAAMPAGGWTWTSDLHVPTADSIEARVTALVADLGIHDPGFAQYLDEQGEVDWSKVVVAGFSQGAQHARRLAIAHETAGLFMVDGGVGLYFLDQDPDRADVSCVPYQDRQACSPVVLGETPADRWFAIYDASRDGVEADLMTLAWEDSGMQGADRYGDSADEGDVRGPVAYTMQCDGYGPATHLAMSVEGWMPTSLDCDAAAAYPEDAGNFHLFETFVSMFERAGGVEASDDASGLAVVTGHRSVQSSPSLTMASPSGCDSTGPSLPSMGWLAPFALLGLRRRS